MRPIPEVRAAHTWLDEAIRIAEREGFFHTLEVSSHAGLNAFFDSPVQYPLLKGTATNLYRAFVVASLTLLCNRGVVGLLHPCGHLYDVRSKGLRS
jgi:hypothetical protein